jgi:hypothetical protein
MKKMVLLSVSMLLFCAAIPDEGMFPLSELKNIDLKKAGFEMDMKEIYNPGNVSLVDALVRLGGCTGSFVSDEGLIITNHHCAFGSVAAISTPEKNYIKNGFLARTRNEEARTTLPLKITESYLDVSARVMEEASAIDNPQARQQQIANKIRQIIDEEKKLHPDLKIEISEMFVGKSYVLFRYREIKDIRLVYVPPRTIGEFGGESDNWVWPRHNGDFSLVRAYVAPDGSPAEYSEKNVPYKPLKHLKVNPKGANENDFVFVMGYPGRTFRHQPSQFLEYQQKYQLPYISSLYNWRIAEMEEAGRNNTALYIQYSGRIKSLANVAKNYQGKMQGLKRTSLHQKKQEEEKELQTFIDSKPGLAIKYGNVLKDIDAVYKQVFLTAHRDIWMDQLYANSAMFNAAGTISFHRAYMDSLSKDARKKYIADNMVRIKNNIVNGYNSFNYEIDKKLLIKMLNEAALFDQDNQVPGVSKLVKNKMSPQQDIEKFVEKAMKKTKLKDPAYLWELIDKDPEKFFELEDPLIELAREINITYTEYYVKKAERDARLAVLLPMMLEVKMQHNTNNFIPDANATLRLTYGRVKGFTPQDGEYNKPVTTIRGIVEKGQDSGDYEMPELVEELYSKRDFGPFANADLGDVPVGILYNLDTTGGNSGSPVLNSKGELVGVNFDRAYTATINDYAWNESYSRSIGVDIRFVLWVLHKVAKADFLITEMGVPI